MLYHPVFEFLPVEHLKRTSLYQFKAIKE